MDRFTSCLVDEAAEGGVEQYTVPLSLLHTSFLFTPLKNPFSRIAWCR